jgi:glucose/arabinose dehydrogenase
VPKSIITSTTVATLLFVLFRPGLALGQLRTELVADGFVRPVAIVPDPLSPTRLLVAEHRGLVWVIENGVKQPTPMLDVTAEVQNDGNEQGFLGIAVHPAGDRVFVSFSKKRTPDAPVRAIGDTVLRRYRRSSDPVVLDPSTTKDVLLIPQVNEVHRGGDLHFLTDHLGQTRLFMSVGDAGTAHDADVNAQAPGSLFGKMLRLDVEVADDDAVGYRIPSDNPFVGRGPSGTRGEIWAFGYRNPWRFSIDDLGDGRTGAIIVGDVGEVTREELDYEPYQQGGRNYGWPIREGSIDGLTPNAAPAYQPLSNPLIDYPRDIGRTVTGGYVYRGTALPSRYRGRYFVADFFRRVFSVGLAIGPTGEATVSDYIEHSAELGTPTLISTFGRDLFGELYIATFGGPGGTGQVLKIVAVPGDPPDPPPSLTQTVLGSTVSLGWQPAQTGGTVQGYRIEVGSRSGLVDLLQMDTTLTGFVAQGVPNGRYFVRVRAFNDHGISAPSAEVEVRVGCIPPVPPSGLAADVGGGYAEVFWDAAAGATSYVLEAGSAPGLSDVAVIPTPTRILGGPVPPGTYYVRVRAANESCGLGDPSPEIVVIVP